MESSDVRARGVLVRSYVGARGRTRERVVVPGSVRSYPGTRGRTLNPF